MFKRFLLLAALLALSLLAFAPVQAQDNVLERGLALFNVPPTGHFNTFASRWHYIGAISWICTNRRSPF